MTAHADPGDAIITRLSAERFRETTRIVDAVVASAPLSVHPTAGGVGLVAARPADRRASLGRVVRRRLGRVSVAGDLPTAVGLAIVEQPDLAVVDADIGPITDNELAVIFHVYAPATTILLLTDTVDYLHPPEDDTSATSWSSKLPAGVIAVIDALVQGNSLV